MGSFMRETNRSTALSFYARLAAVIFTVIGGAWFLDVDINLQVGIKSSSASSSDVLVEKKKDINDAD